MMSLQYKFGEFPLLLNLKSDSLPTSSLTFFFLTPASWPLLILKHGTVTSGPLHCCVCCGFFFFFWPGSLFFQIFACLACSQPQGIHRMECTDVSALSLWLLNI